MKRGLVIGFVFVLIVIEFVSAIGETYSENEIFTIGEGLCQQSLRFVKIGQYINFKIGDTNEIFGGGLTPTDYGFLVTLHKGLTGHEFQYNKSTNIITLTKESSCSLTPCTDSDGGKNYSKKGTITGLGGTTSDSCKDGNILEEKFCVNETTSDIEEYGCSYICSDGACVEEGEEATCTDSDGGKDYNTKGKVTVGWGTGYDACDGDYIVEQYCYGNEGKTIRFLCSKGCSNGACIGDTWVENESICFDSDGGKEYYIKGTVTIETGVSYDSCFGNILRENYCYANGQKSIDYQCLDNCSNGACINTSAENLICSDETLYGACSTTKPLLCFNGILLDKCLTCGCPVSYKCINDGSCMFAPSSCLDECLQGDTRNCGDIAQNCGNFDSDSCLEWETCSPENLSPPTIDPRNKILDSDAFPQFNEDPTLLPEGSIVNIKLFLNDNSGTGIKKAEVNVFLGETLTKSITLQCERNIVGNMRFICMGQWFVFGLPLDLNTYTIHAIVEDNLGKTSSFDKEYNIQFESVNKSLCKELIPNHNNPKANRANIVFMGYGYENYSDTPEEIVKLIGKYVIDLDGDNYGLFSIAPFRGNEDKFNFWYIDRVESTDLCRGYLCDDPNYLATSCAFNNRYVTNLVNKDIWSNAAYRINLEAKINYEGGGIVIYDSLARTYVHEMGHLFGGLKDEYIQSRGIVDFTTSKKNCYAGNLHTEEECLEKAQWKDFIGNGCGEDEIIDCAGRDENLTLEIKCWEGCGFEFGIFRATYNSIMRNHYGSPFSFNQWNEKLIMEVINNFGIS